MVGAALHAPANVLSWLTQRGLDLVCQYAGHQPSWLEGMSRGLDRPICTTCKRVL